MRVAILQPWYLGWCGHYAMIDTVDTFVFLDDVQFQRDSWQHRNRIKTKSGSHWLTIPIVRNFGQKISDVEINYGTDWQKKHWESINQSYSPRYSVAHIQGWYQTHFEKLVELNMCIISDLIEILGCHRPKFVMASQLGISGNKVDHIKGILKEVGATEWIANAGDAEIFNPKDFDITVTFFKYKHPVYPQPGEFVPYMSVIDLLMNTGPNAIKYIREGL